MLITTPHTPELWLLEVAAAAFCGGIVGSISGLGGGIVIVPVLTIFLGMNIEDAIGASIVSVIAVFQRGRFSLCEGSDNQYSYCHVSRTSTAAGALLGAAVLTRYVNPRVLLLLFGLLLLLSLIPIFARLGEELPEGVKNDRLANFLRLNATYHDKRLGRDVAYNVTGIPAALGIMFGAGIISGLLGIGAGVVKVLAHEIAMKVPTKVSTATSNFMIGVTAAAAAGVYLRRGLVLPYLVVPVATGVLAGAFLGTVLMERMSNAWISGLCHRVGGDWRSDASARFGGESVSEQQPDHARQGSIINDVSAWALRRRSCRERRGNARGILVSFIHGTVIAAARADREV